MTTTDVTLRAADAVFAAEQAVNRARWVVEELQETIASALRVLDDAELDSAKARLSDRGSFYLEAAGEHLGRLRTRCNDMPELTRELFGHLNRVSESVNDARAFLEVADTSDPVVASEVAQLKPRIAVVGEMVALAKPVAQLAAQHVDTAHRASRDVTPASLLEPVTLERSIATAGKELGRADEDVRLLGNVVDHAAASARESAGIASEITDNARRRMSEQSRDPITSPSHPAPRYPGR
ncbi:MAG: hypothetical protein Q8Q02_07450 [Nocardioides sp.]|nr:hypothetical protein [Nocardioides sp.]